MDRNVSEKIKLLEENRRYRTALLLLFTGAVFLVILATMGVVLLLYYVAMTMGWLDFWRDQNQYFTIAVMMGASSIIIGTGLAAVASKISMKPIGKILDVMKRLADGDFSARLSFTTVMAKHPTVRLFVDSFNTMAEELGNTEVLRNDFINNFSHEFKTPIVSIAGFAKLIKHGNLTEEEKEEYLDIIEEESLRLSAMATNVLAMTKVENQTILSDTEIFNLSEQIRNCVLMLEVKWAAKDIQWDIEFGEYDYQGNRELMKQVWINLLDNAIKFSPQGGTVGIKIRDRENQLIVSIRNTGSMIPEEERENVFRKFYQVDRSHAGQGSGLGLAMVKKIVELHKGQVKAISHDDATEFIVNLRKASV